MNSEGGAKTKKASGSKSGAVKVAKKAKRSGSKKPRSGSKPRKPATAKKAPSSGAVKVVKKKKSKRSGSKKPHSGSKVKISGSSRSGGGQAGGAVARKKKPASKSKSASKSGDAAPKRKSKSKSKSKSRTSSSRRSIDDLINYPLGMFGPTIPGLPMPGLPFTDPMMPGLIPIPSPFDDRRIKIKFGNNNSRENDILSTLSGVGSSSAAAKISNAASGIVGDLGGGSYEADYY